MKQWSINEINLLKENWGKYKIEYVAKLVNRTIEATRKKASLLKLIGNKSLAHSKYTVNKTFFSIPNVNNCYWAGLLAADGCINDRENNVAVRLHLKTEDKYLLKKFAKECKYTGKIRDYSSKTSYGQTKYSSLEIFQTEQWIVDLKKHWNITPRKTATLKPPNLKCLEQQIAFIVGYIDGDGWICKDKNNRITIGCCGNFEIILWIKNVLKLNNTIRLNGLSRSNYRIDTRKRDILKLLKEIQIPHRMLRKWNKINAQS